MASLVDDRAYLRDRPRARIVVTATQHPIVPATPPGPVAPAGSAGRRVGGRYEVLESLGEGGAGAVYRAIDLSTGTELALKRLRAHTSTDHDASLRFRKEFHTLARLKHPRIVEVYDYAVDEDGPYYTMELLEGAELRSLAPADPAQACRWLRDVASALAFLHARRLLHRDIAGRNVRCTRDGRAKLIDFGALSTMGYSTQIVGTPPFIAPESLRGRPLDHRADLFGLGALAYWLLTARHAYPARELSDLLQSWQHSPPAPSVISPSVPPALDELVLSLLSIDPLARPASAAEVIDRLTAIGNLENAEEDAVAHSYLQSVALVGRTMEMEKLRRRIKVCVQRRRGQSVLVEAPSGTGKSRLLREVALEAQLAGATVLTADAGTVRGGAYALARQLVQNLLEAQPEVAMETLPSHAHVLARVVPEIALALGHIPQGQSIGDPREEHARIQSEFVAWILDVAEREPLVLLIDDIQLADEGSTSMLASLSHAVRGKRLLLVSALRTDQAPVAEAPIAVLRDVSRRLRLRGLDAAEVKELVRASFGEVRYGDRLAEWMHRMTGGNPLLFTELARHLVDREVIRYVGGMWVMPQAIALDDVPRGLPAAMDARIRSLTPDGRELAEVLSVHGGEIPLELCVLLADSDDAEEVFASLDELVYAEVLIGSVHGYRFRHNGLREALLRNLDDKRRRELHLRVGAALSNGRRIPAEREVEVGWHFLHGGDPKRAMTLLDRGARRLLEAHAFADAIAPLEAVLRIQEELPSDPNARLELQYALVLAGYMSQRSLLVRYANSTITASAKLSGLSLASRLSRILGTHLAFVIGLGWAGLRRAFRGKARGLPRLRDALRMYVMSTTLAIAAATAEFDVMRIRELTDRLRPIAISRRSIPYAALKFAEMLEDFLCGRHAFMREQAEEIYTIVRNERLDELDRKLLEGGARTLLACVPAADGDPACLAEAAALERSGLRVFQVAALQVRAYHHLCRGEFDAARAVQADHEVLALQLGNAWQMQTWRATTEAVAYGLVRDVIGLKRSIDELSRLVEEEGFARFIPNLLLAKGEYHRERGELHESRSALERALERMPRDQSVYREVTLAAYAETLFALSDLDRAEAVAKETIADSQTRNRLHAALRSGRILALVEAARGDFAGAATRLEALIARATDVGNPAACGTLHEARARVALLQRDHVLYRRHLERTEHWFRQTKNPLLIARYERLAKSGTVDVLVDSPLRHADAISTVRDDALGSLRVVLARYKDRVERARRALQVVVDAAMAASGFVLLGEGVKELLVLDAADARRPPETAIEHLRRAIARSRTSHSDASDTLSADSQEASDIADRAYQPIAMVARDGSYAIGISLRKGARPLRAIDPHLLEVITESFADLAPAPAKATLEPEPA